MGYASRSTILVLSLASAATLMAAAPGPVVLTQSERASITKEIEQDRADTERWLKTDPTSYLATVDRRDFGTRTVLTVGRAADNDVRVDGPDFSPHHLRVTVEGERFRVEAVDAGAHFIVEKKDTRSAVVAPSSVGVGRFVLRLSHQGYPAIIVFDPQSPRFKEYKGLKYFPPNLALRYELPLTPNPHPETMIVLSTRGNQRRAVRVGWFDFVRSEERRVGKECA